ncbi:alginate lyase family protein [Leeuwenhoekiella sp. NPDC079379]|uniref:alginate lyase family protein n=1 Tax=Leeuwenhoekiella sp. NPDC079379 TaxID=3364122 RepID=UPI0037CA021C
MNKKFLHVLLLCFFCTAFSQQNKQSYTFKDKEHHGLLISKDGLSAIKANLGSLPLFDNTLEQTKREIDSILSQKIEVPVPKDMAGGYTHMQHKENYVMLQKAGVLFQIYGDEKYANYIKAVFMEYARIYPTLPLHPETRSYSRGKLFWQCLNDANWLVNMSQAYDAIYDWLSPQDRKKLERQLFRPFAMFLSIENPQFFNRIHNHSTWGNAAVGMMGLAMRDSELINYALYGLPEDSIDENAVDNDGGLIKKPGQDAGFLANIEEAFSPDGYYTEGPYYQRYAMYPFLAFSAALENTLPQLKVLQFKDNVQLKAVYALLNLTDSNGDFFPLNDAQKGMSYYNSALVNSVDIAYHYGNQDRQLLALAKTQNEVTLDDAGLAVAFDLKEQEMEPFEKKSLSLTDGPDGKQGGVTILRSKPGSDLELVFKYSAQGNSHGHYDKLSYSVYENGDEVLPDYGLARFVNINAKNGGGYLKENTTWAKQTIAHNTLVRNKVSHFNGDFKTGSEHHSELYFQDINNDNIQVVSAKENNAYPGTAMHRTLAMLPQENNSKPLLLDILKVQADVENQYDLPFYYKGQLIDISIKPSAENRLEPLGLSNGYQHLWKEATAKADTELTQITWLNKDLFYTLSSKTTVGDSILFVRQGANDPEFNLRREAGILFRKAKVKNALFVNILESHGTYNTVNERAENTESAVKNMDIEVDTEAYTAVKVDLINDTSYMFIIANLKSSTQEKHKLTLNGTTYTWDGPYYFTNR